MPCPERLPCLKRMGRIPLNETEISEGVMAKWMPAPPAIVVPCWTWVKLVVTQLPSMHEPPPDEPAPDGPADDEDGGPVAPDEPPGVAAAEVAEVVEAAAVAVVAEVADPFDP